MKTKDREKLLKIVAIGAVIFLIGDQFVLKPLMARWDETAEKIETLRDKYEKGQNLVDRERSYSRAWRIMQRDALDSNKPAAEQNVLESLEEWKKQSKIKLTGLQPQWREHDDRYQTYGIRLSAEGNIQECASFIHLIESAPIAVKIEEIELVSKVKDGSSLGLNLFFTGLQLGKSLQQ